MTETPEVKLTATLEIRYPDRGGSRHFVEANSGIMAESQLADLIQVLQIFQRGEK